MNGVLLVLIVIATVVALGMAVTFTNYRHVHGCWPFGCANGQHRKKRTLRTLRGDPAHYSEFARRRSWEVTDVNECARCGAAYEENRPESAAEYAERTKLGEDAP